MKGARVDSPTMGGLYEQQPQPLEGASKAVNLTVDPRTMGWSTRVGYEAYRVDLSAGFVPYQNADRIDSLYVFEDLSGGLRQSILFESAGKLMLQYEVAGAPVLKTIRTNRAVPSASTAPSNYTEVAGGVLVTNGFDAPLFVRPWPYCGSGSITPEYLARNFGVPEASAPFIHNISPVQQEDPAIVTGNGTSLFVPAHPRSLPSTTADQFGIGYSRSSSSGDELESEYAWQVSYVTDTGSEGALSVARPLQWDSQGPQRYRYAALLEVPPGPEGVIARRIYRTGNFGVDVPVPDLQPKFVYELTNNCETLVIDGFKTSSLGANAPTPAERGRFPAPRARFSAMFGNRCWLDGGVLDPLALFYSDPGLPEQFGAASYLQLNTEGGPITGLRVFYGMLLVFREAGIDAVVPNGAGGWDVNPVHSGLRCVAPMSADDVPGVGLLFAAEDGIYALTGGVAAPGSVIDVVKVSDVVQDSWSRVTRECLPRSVGKYCPKYREYHLYVAADGNDRPNLGFVWHTDKKAWTLREGFPVSALGRLSTGNLIFGGAEPSVEKGLFVISGRRTLGRRQVGDNFEYGPAPVSRWKSPWLSMSSPQDKKQVQFVTVWVQTTGSVPVTVRVYKDWERTFYVERSYLAQPADAQLMPVLDTVELNAGNTWDRTHAVPLRVAVAQQSCSWFAFEIETSDDLVLVSYSVEFQQRGTITIEGRRA